MKVIPQLKTAFCGFCSNRTGAKLVGWIKLVLSIMEFVTVTLVLGFLTIVVSGTTDEQFGRGTMELLAKYEAYDGDVKHGTQSFIHSVLEFLVEGTNTCIPEILGRQLKGQLQAIFNYLFIVGLVYFLINMVFAAILLIGAYKNNAGCVLFYLIIYMLGIIVTVLVISSDIVYISLEIKMIITVYLLVHGYFTWIVLSFYRELRNAVLYSNHTIKFLPGYQKNLEGDISIIVSTMVPNEVLPEYESKPDGDFPNIEPPVITDDLLSGYEKKLEGDVPILVPTVVPNDLMSGYERKPEEDVPNIVPALDRNNEDNDKPKE